MSDNLKHKAAQAISWSFVDKFGQQALTFITGLVLARWFLSPSDYGLIGLITVFNMLGYTLTDSGFSNALIRKQDVTQTDLSSVFYFNIFIGLAAYLLLFLAAPYIASFYRQPILTSVIRVITLSIPLSALSVIQTTLLLKAVNFKVQARANLIALFCAGGVAIVLAFNGFGVWVLVFQLLVNLLVRNACLWMLSSWRPGRVYSRKSIRELWAYSAKLLLSGVLSAVFNNIYSLLIGKFYPIKDVGYYTQANKYAELPYYTVGSAIQSVTYPIISQIGQDAERLKNAFRKIIRVSAFFIFPIMLGLAAVAEPLVHTIIGEKWLPIVPYMRILCIGYIFFSLPNIYYSILFLKGESSRALWFNIFHKILLVVGIVATFRLGITALVITWAVVAMLYAFTMTISTGRRIHYRIPEQLKDIFPYFFIAIFMAMGVYLLSYVIASYWQLLIVQLFAGALFYLGMVYILGSKVFREIMEIIKSRIK
jgi:O-antigen/teichoic acid export membrane protein